MHTKLTLLRVLPILLVAIPLITLGIHVALYVHGRGTWILATMLLFLGGCIIVHTCTDAEKECTEENPLPDDISVSSDESGIHDMA